MDEETVDTQETPAEESAEEQEPTEDVQEEQPQYITTEQLQEELRKQDQSFRSWLGRRDKETLSHIGNVINERLSQKQETPDEVSTRLLENPRDVIRSEVEAFENERTQKQTTHLNSAMETVGQLMEADPLYQDKDLGGEVVNEIKAMVKAGKVDSRIPPEHAGRIVLADAMANVFRARQGVKSNPLSKNTPANSGGTLTPPPRAAKKVKIPKLDAEAQKLVDRWGYKEEDIAKVLGE